MRRGNLGRVVSVLHKCRCTNIKCNCFFFMYGLCLCGLGGVMINLYSRMSRPSRDIVDCMTSTRFKEVEFHNQVWNLSCGKTRLLFGLDKGNLKGGYYLTFLFFSFLFSYHAVFRFKVSEILID